MEIDDNLDVFRQIILRDHLFNEAETHLGAQPINELSVNGLKTLKIEFKKDCLTLSSDVAFRLHRARERLIINYEPCIGINTWDLEKPNFLKVVGRGGPRLYRDEEEVEKEYRNLYRDVVYMRSIEHNQFDNKGLYVTPLKEQIALVRRQCEQKLNEQLAEPFEQDEGRRALLIGTLEGHCHGFYTKEEIARFNETKERYKKERAIGWNKYLEEEIALVTRWGSLGEEEMRHRAKEDLTFKGEYLKHNATHRKEWCLRGSELHQLRFFNLHGTEHVDFYNRSFEERPIAFGSHRALKAYEHMYVGKGITPISYTGDQFLVK